MWNIYRCLLSQYQLKNKIKYFYISLYQRMLIAPCVAVALPLDLGANNGNLLKFPKLVYGLTICIVSLYKLPVHRIVQMYN